ncbi:MliC family protein [Aromatoleum petrolei]|uniref:C-type lysozyme inhibitor domain-containing protein n=1 Tax=Aromatoleum petrolei TaxID=76116 RepID=A0ABX1MVI9_9RHOO|nr:MliC family protein [Aromatoleum petrolei]NMF90341.1 hypothetical protein [Aromatoleum petrolei]QTQ37964.1 C-type lysozyme inhibitor superfamily protein [Aromatoleum petrolei]
MTTRTIALPALLVAALLAGCAQTPPAARPVAYACDAGKHFSVTYHPWGDASIDIERMHFALMREAADASGERYACGALTLWRSGDTARVDIQGAGLYENCRASR